MEFCETWWAYGQFIAVNMPNILWTWLVTFESYKKTNLVPLFIAHHVYWTTYKVHVASVL